MMLYVATHIDGTHLISATLTIIDEDNVCIGDEYFKRKDFKSIGMEEFSFDPQTLEFKLVNPLKLDI